MTTIKDVAKKSGYSISTVSKALNGYKDISEKAKNKIIKVAEELNYVPDLSLKNITKRESRSIAVIFSGLSKDGAADGIMYNIIAGAFEYANSVNYDVKIFTINAAIQKEISYFRFCKERNIEGAIVMGISSDDPYFEEIISSKLPVVLIDILTENMNVGVVSIDHEKAAQEATNYLIGIGHKNIAMINGKKNAVVSKLRENGFKKVLEENNMKVNEKWIAYGDFSRQKAFNETYKLLQLYPEITAIFCASDIMAIGVYEAAEKLGISIPDDLSIVGFDNIPLASFITPKLTTVKQDMYKNGYEAAKLLRFIIKNENIERHKILTHELLVRDSTKAINRI